MTARKIQVKPFQAVSDHVISHYSELASIATEWNELTDDDAWSSVFSTHAFVSHWYRCFTSPESVRVLRVALAGKTIGFVPFWLERRSGLNALRRESSTRVLRSLTNLHCLHGTPAVRRGYESEFPRACARALSAAGGWDLLDHEYGYTFLPVPQLIDAAAASEQAMHVRQMPSVTYALTLPTSFEEYRSTHLSFNARKNHLRLRNRLDRAGPNRICVFRGDDAIRRWPELLRIEDAGWKGESGSSLMRLDESYRRYYQGLIELLAARDELSLYFLELSGKLIAGLLGYVEGDVFHWYKTGYDEAYAQFAPSNLLVLGIIEDLIQHHPAVRRFHMFPIDYGYKHRYTNEPHSSFRTVVYNRTLGGRLAHARDSFAEKLRDITWLRNAVRRRRAARA
jgi:CelD/BcsL family acetyltransferase involved in cellulose biosynthesis